MVSFLTEHTPPPPAGLLPYYFLHLSDPARSLEADRCVYNNMFDNPDCKATAVPKIKNVHFTVCQKPWSCFKHDRNVACTPFLEKWYELRNEVRPCPCPSVGWLVGFITATGDRRLLV